MITDAIYGGYLQIWAIATPELSLSVIPYYKEAKVPKLRLTVEPSTFL